MIEQNNKKGIWLMVLVTLIFAAQDGVSRHLAQSYDVRMIVMVRFWFFAAFALTIGYRQTGSLFGALRTSQPIAQAFRSILIVAEICIMLVAFVRLGLVESHAIFASYPLLIAALSGPILGETVGWRRWSAIGIGFLGVLIILNPSGGVFSLNSFWAVTASLMFAIYGLMTRYVSRKDTSITSFVWMGVTGCIAMTAVGIWHLEPMTVADSGWMATLCVVGLLGHYLLIRAYEVAEASAIQPFAYLQLPFASAIGIFVFGDLLRTNVTIGASIVVCAGVFTLLRERMKARRSKVAS
ncbi:DMT family transporter [Marivivens sp.]|jgi:drug/metabolite transporter (DMT)-like permease|uniref:DMT family transporter n=1 Tax=Marivivens sp. TaxID=1978374 RepID=UPI00201FA946|nr:DMT family transporter [Marivivens sp.]MCL7404688.1 DMT family transporter [Marivivens geojensis]